MKKKIACMFCAILLLFTGCSTTASKTKSLAKELMNKDMQEMLFNTPFKFGYGSVDTESITSYYTQVQQKWKKKLQDGSVPKQYEKNMTAQEEISQLILNGINSQRIKDITFLGDLEDKEVTGMFIYYLEDLSIVPPTITTLIADANELTEGTKVGEYYFFKNNYLITFNANYAKNKDDVLKLLDETIK